MRKMYAALQCLITIVMAVAVAIAWFVRAAAVEGAYRLRYGDMRDVRVRYVVAAGGMAEVLAANQEMRGVVLKRMRSSHGSGMRRQEDGTYMCHVSGVGHRRALAKLERHPSVTGIEVTERIGLCRAIDSWFSFGI